MKLKDMTLIAMMTSLICIAGPLSVAAGPVPVSLATFAVYLAGMVLGKKRGAIAAGLYLLIGMAGLPVFSGFSGGFQKIAGVTGGYLIGYLPCAWFSGLGAEYSGDGRKSKWLLPLFLVLGTAILYAAGTAWFMIQTGHALAGALSLCVVPFLPGDAVKIIAVSLIASPVRKAVRAYV